MSNTEFDVHDEDEVREINNFDFDRASMLLTLVEKQSTVWPKGTSLSGIALAELEILNEQAKAIARKRADRLREAEERRAAAEKERIDREAAEAEADAENNRPDRRTGTVEPQRARAIPATQLPQPVPQPGEPVPNRRV